jgi:hypothetical protein
MMRTIPVHFLTLAPKMTSKRCCALIGIFFQYLKFPAAVMIKIITGSHLARRSTNISINTSISTRKSTGRVVMGRRVERWRHLR